MKSTLVILVACLVIQTMATDAVNILGVDLGIPKLFEMFGLPGGREAFVRGLQVKLMNDTKGKGLNTLIYNMNQEYEDSLLGIEDFKQTNAYQRTFGVWVFKCGTFRNKGEFGYNNWAFSGNWDRSSDLRQLTFYHPECPDSSYRKRS